MESPALPVIPKCACYPIAVFQQSHNRVFHEDVQAEVYPMVLQCANHLQASPVAHMRQPRIPMTTEVPLQDLAVGCPIEDRAPRFQLADTRWRLFGVQLGHPPTVQVLASTHRVCEVDAPVISIVDVRKRGCDSAFRHYGMRLAEQRFRDHSNLGASSRSSHRCPQARASCSNNQNIVLMG